MLNKKFQKKNKNKNKKAKKGGGDFFILMYI